VLPVRRVPEPNPRRVVDALRNNRPEPSRRTRWPVRQEGGDPVKKRKAAAAEVAPNVADEKRWQAEDDLRTIQRAHEIMGDTGRLSAAKAHAKRQRDSLDRISRLKDQKL
jgi:hypothetical protein